MDAVTATIREHWIGLPCCSQGLDILLNFLVRPVLDDGMNKRVRFVAPGQSETNQAGDDSRTLDPGSRGRARQDVDLIT